MLEIMAHDLNLLIWTECGNYHIISCRFASQQSAEEHESFNYHPCRNQISEWLSRHYPGQVLLDDEYEIREYGEISDFPNDVFPIPELVEI